MGSGHGQGMRGLKIEPIYNKRNILLAHHFITIQRLMYATL